MIKQIGRINSPDLMGKDSFFTIIELEETHLIGNDPLTEIHRYWVPENCNIHDEDAYLEPLNDPDYNIRQHYALYRQRFHFLTATEITVARQNLDLTLDEAALILGLDVVKLSGIENHGSLQFFDQEILLRLLTEPDRLWQYVQQYHTLIELRATQRKIDVDQLFAKLEKINIK
ncbi:hypothetical protein [Levilactobacillus enshiensis]|uniref:hypothetical protein n=1 Tax=Levilactobacillus enshiensis TaxID=2590213 RepID=UPI00117BC3F2|nr:hypothetical protein [Levilactobacillus enshiensis]